MPAAKKVGREKAAYKDAAEVADAVHEKRADYDNPPVDAPVPIVEAFGEVESEGEKSPNLEIVQDGPNLKVSIGSASVVLDRENQLAALRHFRRSALNA